MRGQICNSPNAEVLKPSDPRILEIFQESSDSRFYAKDGNNVVWPLCSGLFPASRAEFFGMTAVVGNVGANDYAATIPVSTGVANQGVPFPRAGFSSGVAIPQPTHDSFHLARGGSYRVEFNISIVEAGNLMIESSQDGIAWVAASHEKSLVGRATGTSLINGSSIVTAPNDVDMYIRIANPTGGLSALTVETAAGSGTRAHVGILSIERIA